MAEITVHPREPRCGSHEWDVVVVTDTGASQTQHALGALDADGRAWVWVDGDVMVIEPLAVTERRASQSVSPDSLAAPMPATVVSVHAAAGDRVAAGDVLVLLEAMKMELPLRAPHAGVVTEVRCAAGDRVQPGATLVTLGESDERA